MKRRPRIYYTESQKALMCVDLAHFKNRNNQDIIQPTKPLRSPLC